MIDRQGQRCCCYLHIMQSIGCFRRSLHKAGGSCKSTSQAEYTLIII